MAKKFAVNDKVVPTKKTVGVQLSESQQWSNVMSNNKPYLRIQSLPNDPKRKWGTDKAKGAYVLASCLNDGIKCDGDYFADGDFISYEEAYSEKKSAVKVKKVS